MAAKHPRVSGEYGIYIALQDNGLETPPRERGILQEVSNKWLDHGNTPA